MADTEEDGGMARKRDEEEDAVLAAQRRAARIGRSFFPAANFPQGQIIQNTGAGQGGIGAINATVGMDTRGTGTSGTAFGGFRALPPDQNPTYQAAIAKGRPDTSGYVWLQSPQGGQMRVPASSVAKLHAAMPGSYVEPTGPLTPQQYASNYQKGYGETPYFNPATQALASGGVQRPVEQMSPAQRTYYGAPTPPNLYQRLQAGFNSPQAQSYAANVSTGQMPSHRTAVRQPYGLPANPFSMPTNLYSDYRPPRRYSDLGYY